MSEIPEEVRALAARREEVRQARDFARADALRDRIRDAGFDVTDTERGPVLTPRSAEGPPAILRRSDEVESVLGDPPAFDASIQWVVEGWPEDVLRGIESFRSHSSGHAIQLVVVDLTTKGAHWPSDVDVVRLVPDAGWAAARNAGLRRSAGHRGHAGVGSGQRRRDRAQLAA